MNRKSTFQPSNLPYMNIAYKIMTGKDVSKDELKYLLFLTLSEYQHHTSNETVGITDELECFNMDDMLDTLSYQLEGIEGGK